LPDTSIARVSKPAAKIAVVPKTSLQNASTRAVFGQVDKSASARKSMAVESSVVSHCSQALAAFVSFIIMHQVEASRIDPHLLQKVGTVVEVRW